MRTPVFRFILTRLRRKIFCQRKNLLAATQKVVHFSASLLSYVQELLLF